MEIFASEVARMKSPWAANETWRLATILAAVRSQMWRSHPYSDDASTTQMVVPAPKTWMTTGHGSVILLLVHFCPRRARQELTAAAIINQSSQSTLRTMRTLTNRRRMRQMVLMDRARSSTMTSAGPRVSGST